MKHVATITSQGQLTIPASMRKSFDITGQTKALITKQGNQIIVEPQTDFWSLGGSLHSRVKLTDQQLQDAKLKFQSQWSDTS